MSSPSRPLVIGLAASAFAFALACSHTASAEPPKPTTPLAKRGAALVATYQCDRCHGGLATTAVRDKHCVECHQQIMAGTFKAPAKTLAQWQKNIVHLKEVPSLQATERRFDKDGLAAFLREPSDVRPRLGASMPRLSIPAKDAEAIAAYLTGGATSKPAPKGDLDAGRAAMIKLGCATCHLFGGLDKPLSADALPIALSGEALTRGLIMAPDLRYTRDRFRPDALVAWLEDPKAVKPDTSMPTIPMTNVQARDITAFILTTPLRAPRVKGAPKRLPVLDRPVAFDEVNAKVFRKVCWHCHSDPGFADGDGGPGNTGGFGYKGRRISFADYESVMAGGLDAKGAASSLFAKDASGTPWLVRALHARHAEVKGRPVEGVLGMPLGLPPLPLADIQLVESWIAQGRPL